jgi:hypothetical protein
VLIRTEAHVEAHRGVVLLDVDAHRLPRRKGPVENVPHDRSTDSPAPPRRDQRNVDDAELVVPLFEVEAPDRHPAFPENKVESRAGVLLSVVFVLRFELLPQKRHNLLRRPARELHLLRARARVKRPQKRQIARALVKGDRTEGDLWG